MLPYHLESPLRVPWTARRSNQSILKEISPEYSLKGLMLKLKLWYFGHLMQRADSFEKPLMLGKTEVRRRRDDRGRDGWSGSPTQWTWVWVNSRSWWWTGRPGMLQSIGSQIVGYDWVTELNSSKLPRALKTRKGQEETHSLETKGSWWLNALWLSETEKGRQQK